MDSTALTFDITPGKQSSDLKRSPNQNGFLKNWFSAEEDAHLPGVSSA